MQINYPVEALLARSRVAANQDKTRAWSKTISARPGYGHAADKGGPVML
jgi:hypothetical protein